MASSVGVLAIVRASRPVFRSKHERVVFAMHSVMMANGLRLLATGDKVDQADAVNPSEDADVDGWNASSDQYSFLYALEVDKKVSKVLVKCLPLDGLLLCNLLNMDAPHGAPETVELDVEHYATDANDVASSYQDLPGLVKRVQDVLEDITAPTKVPSAGAGPASTSRASEDPLPASVHPSTRGGGSGHDDYDPLRLPTRPNPYAGGGGGGMGGRGGHDPLMVGGRDVVPPGFPAPGGGRRGDPFGGGGVGGGGMHMGPDDPFFTERMRHPDLHPGGHPPPGLPPGSRWDPINPPGLPGWQPGDFQRQGQPPLHPDLQQPGPGRGTDWDSMYG